MSQLEILTGVVTDLVAQVQTLRDNDAALQTSVAAAVAALNTGNQDAALDALTGQLNQAKEHLGAVAGDVALATQRLTDAVTPPQP